MFVKFLSGDLIRIETAKYIPCSELYAIVYEALDNDVQPQNIYQMTLLRGEGEEIDFESIYLLNAEEDDIFHLFIDPHTYGLRLKCLAEAYDMNQDPAKRYDTICFYVYQYLNGEEIVRREETFFLDPSTEGVLYDSDRVTGEWTGRFDDELAIHIPVDAPSFDIQEITILLSDRICTEISNMGICSKLFLKRWMESHLIAEASMLEWRS